MFTLKYAFQNHSRLWSDSKSNNTRINLFIYFRIFLEENYDFDPFEDWRKTVRHFLILNGFKDIIAQKSDEEKLEYLRRYLDINPTESFLFQLEQSRSGEDNVCNIHLKMFAKTKKKCFEMMVGDFIL